MKKLGPLFLLGILLVLVVIACRLSPAPTQAPTEAPTEQPAQVPTEAPTPTSHIENQVNKSMIHLGTFRLTVTTIEHLSNAVRLNIAVENASDQSADWYADDGNENVYMVDGSNRLSSIQFGGIFAQDASLEAGATETGWFVFSLPTHDTFRFYYPNSEPAYLTIQTPGH